VLFSAAILFGLASKPVRPWFLLAASLAFYGTFNWAFLILLVAVIACTYAAGRFIQRHPHFGWQVPIWTLAVMSPLLFYKYLIIWFPWMWESFIPVSTFDLEGYGTVLIPVGLSFFTFQCLSYIFDVRRGYYPPERNPLRFGLFIAFFPQLLAGPIERWPSLSKQLFSAERPTPDMVLDGLQLLAYGFFMKLALADWLGFYVDAAYVNPAANSSVAAFLGLYGFTFQIYGDFCGYSLIALGSARLFGIKLIINFRQPLFARDIEEFWQRWHISLTRWIGDYVYRPLGVQMIKIKWLPKRAQESAVLLVTWIAMGLWHGAKVPFLIFGLIMAILFILNGFYKRGRRRRPRVMSSLIGWVVTFHLIVVAFALIRAETMEDWFGLLKAAFAFSPGHVPFSGILVNIFIALFVVMGVDAVRRFWPDYRLKNLYSRTAVIGLLVIWVLVLGHDDGKTIIYFGF
jgi:D-alanyl-lipoteichoic acid acyltransferase DltB (MBOAT superfamily)